MYMFDFLRECLQEMVEERRNLAESEKPFDKTEYGAYRAYLDGEIHGLKRAIEFLPSHRANKAQQEK